MRRWNWLCMVVCAGGLFLIQSGCAEQKPKAGGNTSVNPAATVKPGVPATTPPVSPESTTKTDDASTTSAEPAEPVEKPATTDTETPPKTPADAGSTTGGGTELPAKPE